MRLDGLPNNTRHVLRDSYGSTVSSHAKQRFYRKSADPRIGEPAAPHSRFSTYEILDEAQRSNFQALEELEQRLFVRHADVLAFALAALEHMTVGTPRTPYFCVTPGASSISSLPTLYFP